MLRSERLRYRDRGGAIEPSFVSTSGSTRLLRSEELIELVAQHDGALRGELDDALEDYLSEATQLKLWRGLADVLLDRCRFEVESPWDPVELRRTLFERSAARFPLALSTTAVERATRQSVIAELAQERRVEPETIERALYADLDESQRIVAFDRPTAVELHELYNLALCQGLLCHALELCVELPEPDPKELRQLVRYLRFFQLMFRIERRGTALAMTIDGPSSLLRQSKKYGVKLASFLPAMLLVSRWSAVATVELKGQRRSLALGPEQPLARPFRARGTWISEEESRLRDRLAGDFADWELIDEIRVIELGGQQVTIPDLTLRHRPSGGEVSLEIIGFWRRSYLERRIEALARSTAKLLLLVSQRLSTDETKSLAEQGRLVTFRGVIVAKTVVERAAELLGVASS